MFEVFRTGTNMVAIRSGGTSGAIHILPSDVPALIAALKAETE